MNSAIVPGTSPGTYTCTIAASNRAGFGTRHYTLAVNPPPPLVVDTLGDNFDYDSIVITRGSLLGSGVARTTANTINLSDDVAENLKERDAPVHICPEQGFVMKNLVQHIKRALAPSNER